MNPLFSLQKLTFEYPQGTKALKDLNLTIKTGTKTALLGCNGAGKSTLIQHLNGLLKPTKGSLSYKNIAMDYKKKNLQKLRQKIGIVMQDPDVQIFSPYVMDELVFGPLNFGVPKEEAIARAKKVIKSLKLEHLVDQATHQLSFGQKKQISIAAILTCEPEVLVLDEPFAGLDPYHRGLLIDTLQDLHYQGLSIIICTHDVDFAYEWAEDILIFSEGQCIQQGSPEEVFSDDEALAKGHLKKPRLLDLYSTIMTLHNEFKLEDAPKDIASFKNILERIQ